jgi:hypothetical protein
MSRLLSLLTTPSNGRAALELTPAEMLHDLRALRRRHAAIAELIAALEEAGAAGCDLTGVWCETCPLEKPGGRRRLRAVA